MGLLLTLDGKDWKTVRGLTVWGLSASESDSYYSSWVEQNYIWYPESYPTWWG